MGLTKAQIRLRVRAVGSEPSLGVGKETKDQMLLVLVNDAFGWTDHANKLMWPRRVHMSEDTFSFDAAISLCPHYLQVQMCLIALLLVNASD